MTKVFSGNRPVTLASLPEVEAKGNFSNRIALSNISFSGADAVATITIPNFGRDGKTIGTGESIVLGELQTLSYSIHRENSPVRTVGHVNPRGFVKGSRTIAGSLIFTVFNEYVFYRISQYREYLGRRNGFFAPLADMLPPFDIIISFFNEYGQGSKMKIFGVTIVDEGQTISIDDLITEQTYTYMARGIQPMVKLSPEDDGTSTIDPSLIERDIQIQGYNSDPSVKNITRNIFGDKVRENLAKVFRFNPLDEVVK